MQHGCKLLNEKCHENDSSHCYAHYLLEIEPWDIIRQAMQEQDAVDEQRREIEGKVCNMQGGDIVAEEDGRNNNDSHNAYNVDELRQAA